MKGAVDLLARFFKSRTVDDVSTVFDKGLQERTNIAHIIFKVSILHTHDISSGGFNAELDGRSFPLIGGLMDDSAGGLKRIGV